MRTHSMKLGIISWTHTQGCSIDDYPCPNAYGPGKHITAASAGRSEEHTSELQSRLHLVCRLLLEKKKKLRYALLSGSPSSVAQKRAADNIEPEAGAQLSESTVYTGQIRVNRYALEDLRWIQLQAH